MDNIYRFEDGRASFTRATGTRAAWHKLGGETPANAPIETWQINAGMNYTVERGDVVIKTDQGEIAVPNKSGFYRSDTGAPLSVMGNRYQVHQPREILEFFRDISSEANFTLDTAGVLGNGATYWALATNGNSQNVGTAQQPDRIKPYLLLATACDGSMATTASFTSVRVVCQNTLNISLSRDKSDTVKIRHSSTFDGAHIRAQLGLSAHNFDQFYDAVDNLASTRLTDSDFMHRFLLPVLDIESSDLRGLEKERKQTYDKVFNIADLFVSRGAGSDLASAKGTAWGAVNAVTEYVDHIQRGHSDNNRVNSMLFGSGDKLKSRAFEHALELVA